MRWAAFFEQQIARFPVADQALSRRELRALAASLGGKSTGYVTTTPDWELSPTLHQQLVEATDAALAGKPWAYLFGSVPFLDYEFKVDERALIPRPETEWLVDSVIRAHRDQPPRRILDLCCGSGCIGLSLAAAFPASHAVLTDVSEEALALTAENAAALGLSARIRCYAGDLWAALPDATPFDLITANPPYIGREEVLDASVTDHEPHVALFSDDGGMAHIKRILNNLARYMNPGGCAVFELSHLHRQSLATFLEQKFNPDDYNWELDARGVARFLWVFPKGRKA